MRISLIVAKSENDVIGRDNDIPWRLSNDLRQFRRLTTGHSMIMGRRTYESIGRPLPGRRSIVITRDASYRAAEGVVVVGSLEEAIEVAATPHPDTRESDELFIIGGRSIYDLALPRADRIYLTRVHAAVEGDVRFEESALADFELTSEERHEADERNEHAHSFCVYERRSG